MRLLQKYFVVPKVGVFKFSHCEFGLQHKKFRPQGEIEKKSLDMVTLQVVIFSGYNGTWITRSGQKTLEKKW